MSNIEISVIIPVYNTALYLEKCIISVLNQSLKNIEIIIINDGSTDNSLEIINNFLNIDKRIKLINKNNMGLSEARNDGIHVARGKYIFFLDSDDYLEEGALELLYKRISKDKSIDLIRGNYKIFYQNDYEITRKGLKKVHIESRISILNYIRYMNQKNIYIFNVWNYLFKTNIIKSNNIKFLSELHIGEDDIFTLEYMKHCNYVDIIDKPIYNYRIRELSSTNSFTLNKLEGLLKCYKFMEELLNKNKKFLTVKYFILQRYLAIIIYFLSRINEDSNNINKAIEKIKKILKGIKIDKKLNVKFKIILYLAKINIKLTLLMLKLLKVKR